MMFGGDHNTGSSGRFGAIFGAIDGAIINHDDGRARQDLPDLAHDRFNGELLIERRNNNEELIAFGSVLHRAATCLGVIEKRANNRRNCVVVSRRLILRRCFHSLGAF